MVLAPYALDPPPTGRLLLRGLVRHCPLCGSDHLFRWWLLMRDECPRCDLRFERIEGHWIGAIAINTVLSLGLLLGIVIVGATLSYPESTGIGIMIIAGATAAIAPLFLQPVSRTLWTAIDLAMRPIEISEISETDEPNSTP